MKTLEQLKQELFRINTEIEAHYPGTLKTLTQSISTEPALVADVEGSNGQDQASAPLEDLSLKVEYSPENLQSKNVFSSSNFKAVALALMAEQALKTHTTPVDAMLVVLEGFVSFNIFDKEHKLFAGNIIKIPAGVRHSLKAIINSKILLVK